MYGRFPLACRNECAAERADESTYDTIANMPQWTLVQRSLMSMDREGQSLSLGWPSLSQAVDAEELGPPILGEAVRPECARPELWKGPVHQDRHGEVAPRPVGGDLSN